MTTREAAWTPQYPRIPWGKIILALVVVATVLLAAKVFLLRDHALKHSDAPAIRRCLEQNGPSQIWARNDRLDIKYLLCQLEDGRTCWMIAQDWRSLVSQSDYREITSYCPNGGVYVKVMNWLEKNAIRIWPGL